MDYRSIILSLEEGGYLTINNENIDYVNIEQLIKDKKKSVILEDEVEKNNKPFKFFSNAKIDEDSDYRLCNLYECLIDNYPSVQHAYESLRYPKIQRVRFTVDGDLGSFDALSKFYEGEMLEKVRTQVMKKGMIGKVAILSSKNWEKIGLSKPKDIQLLDGEPNPKKVQANQLLPILRKKFEIDEFRRVLLSTGDRYLLNFFRVPREKTGLEFWGGCIRDDKLYGENTLGQYLTKIRDEIV